MNRSIQIQSVLHMLLSAFAVRLLGLVRARCIAWLFLVLFTAGVQQPASAMTLPADAGPEVVSALKKAHGGEAASMFFVAEYLLGEANMGADEYLTHAFGWALNSARKGHPQAAELTGVMYRRGLGVEQNYVKARKWLERAEARQSREPYFELALLYADEENPCYDKRKAADLLTKAIRRREPRACMISAQNSLKKGIAFRKTLPDIVCAAEGGMVDAMMMMADYHIQRRSPNAISEARYWLKMAIEAGAGNDSVQKLAELNAKSER